MHHIWLFHCVQDQAFTNSRRRCRDDISQPQLQTCHGRCICADCDGRRIFICLYCSCVSGTMWSSLRFFVAAIVVECLILSTTHVAATDDVSLFLFTFFWVVFQGGINLTLYPLVFCHSDVCKLTKSLLLVVVAVVVVSCLSFFLFRGGVCGRGSLKVRVRLWQIWLNYLCLCVSVPMWMGGASVGDNMWRRNQIVESKLCQWQEMVWIVCK
jgi:hypothetical protein